MSAEDAKSYGVVDEVVKSRKDVKEPLPQNGDRVLAS
jgi:ATP-dependent protease ClpP protease subunit